MFKVKAPQAYKNGGGPVGWDLSVAGLFIPVTVTLLEGATHDFLGVEIPHYLGTFGGTLLGCMIAVWFTRRFRPRYVTDKPKEE